jgi:hypothetical protein
MSPKTSIALTLAAAGTIAATTASAQICDYRPSQILRSDLAGNVLTGARDAASRIVASAGGILTLNNVATGTSLLGSGAGGAGTLGQIGSAAGNAAAGVVATPGAAIAGTAAVLGAGAYEGVCYFRDERITDYDEVLGLMHAVAAYADPAYFRVEDRGSARDGAVIVLGDGTGETVEYAVARLRIVNGVLLHREWGRDAELGNLGILTATLSDD